MQWRNVDFVRINCIDFIAIFGKYTIKQKALFFGKFLRRDVPREIVSRATLVRHGWIMINEIHQKSLNRYLLNIV